MNDPGHVRVRFAPSPTGFLHIGSARTAIFNWLFARHENGALLLRVEDTDLKRSEERFLHEILEDLRWLGITFDGEPLHQSARFDVYRARASELVDRGLAYRDGEAILFRMPPDRTIEYEDLIHGPISVKTETIKDQVLVKSDGSPSYNFACVVDDAHMGITHILRGDDHISNTPKQILFYEAFGLTPPRFGHMPLILGRDGAKLSKRHGGVSVEEYRREGFLPEALANYLYLLGWTPPGGREILPPDEAVRLFDIKDMTGVQAKFDLDKLRWMNGEYIMRKSDAELSALVRPYIAAAGLDPDRLGGETELRKVVDLYRVRLKTLSEILPATDFFFTDDFAVDEEGKAVLADPANRARLEELANRLERLGHFSRDEVEKIFREYAAEQGVKAAVVIHPARMAVSGKTKGAGLFEILETLGRDRAVERLRRAARGNA